MKTDQAIYPEFWNYIQQIYFNNKKLKVAKFVTRTLRF